MTGNDQIEMENPGAPTVLRYDWILLTLAGLLTITVLIALSELSARKYFKDAETQLAPCLILNDSSTGVRGLPNSQCWAKGSESAWDEYKFNSCGHRTGMECGQRLPGKYRIVMTGSSIAMGLHVQVDKSIAGLLPVELSSSTGQNVELYNTSIGAADGGAPHSISLRFNEIVAAKPDLLLWIITPWDVNHAAELKPESDYLGPAQNSREAQDENLGPRGSAMRRLSAKIGAESAADSFYAFMKGFRFRVLLTHYLYKSRSLYVRSYLMNPDDKVGFLKSQWSPEWKDRLNEFDGYSGEIAKQAKDAGIPLVAVLIPNRAQAAMISAGEWPDGYDPYKIDNEVRSSITSHGGKFVDIFPEFRTVPNPEESFMPVDGHPYEEGHAMLAKMIAKQMIRNMDLKLGSSQSNTHSDVSSK